MTCPFCNEWRGDGYECKCLGVYNAEMKIGRIPPGISKEAFEYFVWRDVRGLEQMVAAHPERYPDNKAQEELQAILQRAEEDYQTSRRLHAFYSQEEELMKRPPVKLY